MRAVIFVLITGLAAIPAEARTIGAYLEGGLGTSNVQPLLLESANSMMCWAGVSVPVGHLRGSLTLAASAGGQVGHYIPEAPVPGKRTLTTILLGLEFVNHETLRGAFATLGVGGGHYTLSRAKGIFEPPFEQWLVPPRDLTAFAVGGGVGYRTRGGKPLGFQLSLRTHMLIHGSEVPVSAYAMTLGLAY